MNLFLNDNEMIYVQIAKMIEDDILKGIYLADEQIPSTNEMSKILHINPATAAKGINKLVDENILYKKRGIGMFVSQNSKDIISQKRKDAFCKTYISDMLKEAKTLNISVQEIIDMIDKTNRGE